MDRYLLDKYSAFPRFTEEAGGPDDLLLLEPPEMPCVPTGWTSPLSRKRVAHSDKLV